MTAWNIDIYQLEYVFVVIILLSAILISKFLHHLTNKSRLFIVFTESSVMTLLGVVIGSINYFAKLEAKLMSFNTSFFHYLLLPVIIFEAGYAGLRIRGLNKNLGTILMYSIFGTLISVGFTTFSLFGIGYLVEGFGKGGDGLVQTAVYGAIISAVDPVATLSGMQQAFNLKPNVRAPYIYTIIAAESLINDAIAMVLFRIFLQGTKEDFQWYHIFVGLGLFFYVTVGSVLLGILNGLFCAFLLKKVNFHSAPAMETIILLLFAMGSYLLGEFLKMSGILSIFVFGIIAGHYAWFNLSTFNQLATPQTFKSLSIFSENIIFAYLGLAVFSFMKIHQETFSSQWSFILIQLFICLISRVPSIIIITILVNFFRKHKVTLKHIILCICASLRGAIAFALALEVKESDVGGGNIIISSALVVILTTVIIGGGITGPILAVLKLKKTSPDEPEAELNSGDENTEASEFPNPKKESKVFSLFRTLDRKFITPFFVRDSAYENSELKLKSKYLKYYTFESQGHNHLDSPMEEDDELSQLLSSNQSTIQG